MIKGFSSEKTLKSSEQKYATLQPVGSGKHGIDSIVKSVFELASGAVYTISDIRKKGSSATIASGQQGTEITAVGLGAVTRRGDVLRLQTGSKDREEIAIIEVIDNDNVIIGHPLELADIGSTTKALRHNTLTLDDDGNLNVAVTGGGPIQYVEDGVDFEVEIDTATPANNRPLPSTMYIEKDGVRYPVTRDTATPANNVAVPVEILGAAGQDINITAGDINVQLSDTGANPDVTRIGDGTNQLAVNASNEALVKDTDTEAAIQALQASQSKSVTEPYILRDFASSNLAAAFVTERTLVADIKKIHILNNSGGEILLRVTAAGNQIIIGQGASMSIDYVGVAGDDVEIRSLSGTISSGKLYLNFEG